MSKLDALLIESARFQGRGIRPWNDVNVVKPQQDNTSSHNKPNNQQGIVSTESSSSYSTSVKKDEDNTSSATSSNQIDNKMPEIYSQAEQIDLTKTTIGNEKKLLQFIWQKCQLNCSLESPAITTDELIAELKVSSVRIRNLIYRLSNKKLIEISKVKNGRTGWRIFKLSKEALRALGVNQNIS